MFKTLLLTLCLLPLILVGQAPSIIWENSYGGTGNDFARSVEYTYDSGYIISGISNSTDGQVTGKVGPVTTSDYWVAKINNLGVLQWQHTYGGTNREFNHHVLQALDSGYILTGTSWSTDGDVVGNHAGGGAGDYWLIKISDTGVLDWQNPLGGTGTDNAYAVALTYDSGYVTTGRSNSSDGDVSINQGGYDAWVVKVDDTGAIVWETSLGGSADDEFRFIIETSDSGFIAAGMTNSTDGNVSSNNGGEDAWAVKIDKDGNIEWEHALGGSLDDAFRAVKEKNGEYIFVGYTFSSDGDISGANRGSGDNWVVSLDLNGNLNWEKTYGGTAFDYLQDIHLGPCNQIYVGGSSGSNNFDVSGNNGGEDMWLAELNDTGALLWQDSYGGSGAEFIECFDLNSQAEFVLAGPSTSLSGTGDVNSHIGGNDFWGLSLTAVSTANSVICKDTVVFIDSLGLVIIDSSFIIDTVTGCYPDSIWLEQDTFSCLNAGTNLVKLYYQTGVTIDSCQSSVLVLDTIKPIISCLDTTIYLVNDTLIIDTSFVFDLAYDNCGILNITLLDSIFTCADTGINSVPIEVIDIEGNRDTCYALVTIIDTIGPIINCMDTVVYLNSLGQLTIDSSYVISSITSNCLIDSIWMDTNMFTCDDTGVNFINVFVRDVNGDLDTCTSIVTVIDSISPIIYCSDSVVYLDNFGQFAVDTSFFIDSIRSSCGYDSTWISITNGDCSMDTIQITSYVLDNNGKIDSCSSNLYVVDTILPTIICKDTTVYFNATGQFVIDTSFVLTFLNDNCGIDSVWLSDSIVRCTNDTLNITVYIQDLSGNIDSCMSQIIGIDTLPPFAVCQNMNAFLDITGNIIIDSNYTDALSFDNCNIDSMYTIPNSFTCNELGANTVQLFVRDESGFWDSCSSIVTVLDTISPVANCIDTTVYLTGGIVIIDSSFVENGSTDNCGVNRVLLSQYTFNCNDVGTNTITITVTDTSGNSSICTSTVTVIDSILPVAVCRDTTIYINGTGLATIDSALIDNGSSDDCGYQVSFNQQTFTCANLGLNQVWMYVIDGSGNTDSCQAAITVLDTLAPVVNCQNVTAYLDANGNATISASNIDNGTVDNCNISSLTINQSIFDCSHVGLNSVTLIAVDQSNNIDSCTVQVTILDTLNPVLVCPQDQDTTVSSFSCEFSMIDYTSMVSFTDNCGGIGSVITQSPVVGTNIITSSGVIPVTIFVMDVNSNIDSCTFNVVVTCDEEVKVPQFISPNGDGLNDSWDIPELVNYPSNNVKIFNRYGNLVFEKDNYSRGWDGRANFNQPVNFVTGSGDSELPSGTYFYLINLGDGNGSLNGYLQLKK